MTTYNRNYTKILGIIEVFGRSLLAITIMILLMEEDSTPLWFVLGITTFMIIWSGLGYQIHNKECI